MMKKWRAKLGLSAHKRARQRSIDRRNDPLGLTILYTPTSDEPTADIIFVHGLGGTSRLSWCYNRDEDLFWPQVWLPNEPDICTARILSYGYNAYFASQGSNSIAGISDFAKQLLFDMKFGKDASGEDLGVGQRPVIFVVHSLGGLVFKKAVLQGHNDDEYKDSVTQVKAVLFLSTPHRGTNLAESLNRILAVSIFRHAPKQYLSELKRNSPFIEDINEEFRKYAPRLRIFSFYETLETPVGPARLMVLQKASSILAYPQEVTEPLAADHHGVSKFSSREDPNYKTVKGAIQTLVSGYRQARAHLQQTETTEDNGKLLSLLRTFRSSKDDYTSLLHLWRRGTCQEFLSSPEILKWRDAATGSKLLWIHAPPGSGKSVRSAVVIKDMEDRGFRCAYYFFRYGDSGKRSPGSLLQSLIYQIAQTLPAFRRALVFMKDNGVTVEKMPARMIWEKIFTGVLFKIESSQPLYVVVDALDESDSVNTIVAFFRSIETSLTPLRLLVTSRTTPSISTSFDRMLPASLFTKLSSPDNLNDIRLHVESEMEYMHGDMEFRRNVLDAVVERAEGNFLWANLAVKEILQCHSLEDVAQALLEMPAGMESLYRRMEATISRLNRSSDIAIAKAILSWATYSRRPLKVDEFVKALPREVPAIIDLQHTIAQLCGHFVSVDSNDSVILVHKTAKEYLIKTAKLPFEFDAERVHENLFQQSISVFLEQQSRQKLSQYGKFAKEDMPPFVVYAATSWAYHLGRCSAASDVSLTAVVRFLKSSSVLLWVRVLASLRQLEGLITASDALRTFIATRQKLDSVTEAYKHRLADLEVAEQWAIDLLKILGKFSSHLKDDPASIQRLVPQFCPRRSAIYRQFSQKSLLSVRNISNDDWDDCLGRVYIEGRHQATDVTCSTRHLAALTRDGKIIVWDCATFGRVHSLNHDEVVSTICFNSTGEFLASYGYLTTRVWNVDTGKTMYTIDNTPESHALCIAFSEDGEQLTVGLDDRTVAVSFYQESLAWIPINSGFLDDEMGSYLGSPTTMALSRDSTFVAVGYRGSALEVWDVVEKSRANKCKRRPDYEYTPLANWTGVTEVVWHPSGEGLLGIYTDGVVFKWNPFEEFDHQELESDLRCRPSGLQCSPDGVVFLLSFLDGSVRIYNYEHFSLIYKLSSEDSITDICFSMDSRRFYDLRRSYCSIWEPNALLRLPDSDDHGSEADTEVASTIVSNIASESFADKPVRISALATRSFGDEFCYGNEHGLVEMNDTSTLKAQSIGKVRGNAKVTFLVWSQDGNYLAFSEGGSLTVKKVVLAHGGTGSRTFETALHINLDLKGGKIQQIHLHPKGDFVLIAAAKSVVIHELATKRICANLETDGSHQWTNHPAIADQLLAFNMDIIRSYSWETLEVIAEWNTKPAALESGEDETDESSSPAPNKVSVPFLPAIKVTHYVEELLLSTTRNYAIKSISQQGRYHNHWTDMQIIRLSDIQEAESGDVIPISIPKSISKAVRRPLGMIGNNHRLVFVDKGFWICSWCMDTKPETMQRHFFLPRDWVNEDMLGLCAVAGNGIMLVPRKGEVAIIRSSLCSQGR